MSTLLAGVVDTLRAAGYGRAQGRAAAGFTVRGDSPDQVYVSHEEPVYSFAVPPHQWRYFQAVAYYRTALVAAGYTCRAVERTPYEPPALAVTRPAVLHLDAEPPGPALVDAMPLYAVDGDGLPDFGDVPVPADYTLGQVAADGTLLPFSPVFSPVLLAAWDHATIVSDAPGPEG